MIDCDSIGSVQYPRIMQVGVVRLSSHADEAAWQRIHRVMGLG